MHLAKQLCPHCALHAPAPLLCIICSQLRIVLNDGRVQQMTNRNGQGVGPFRVWFKQLDYPGLAMSRAFGDTPCRRIGVTVEPELYVHRLTQQDQLLVVASDGVWEYLSNEQVVEIAGRASSAESAARRVVEAAEAAWRAVDGGHYVDDITAVVLRAAPRSDGVGGRPVSKL
jgi:serine/threonine protein phosphatase PrpC